MRCPGYPYREYSRRSPLRQGYSKIARTVLSPERDAPRLGRDTPESHGPFFHRNETLPASAGILQNRTDRSFTGTRRSPPRQGYSRIARTVLSPERDAPRLGRDTPESHGPFFHRNETLPASAGILQNRTDRSFTGTRRSPPRQGYSRIARTVLSPERDAPRLGRDTPESHGPFFHRNETLPASAGILQNRTDRSFTGTRRSPPRQGYL